MTRFSVTGPRPSASTAGMRIIDAGSAVVALIVAAVIVIGLGATVVVAAVGVHHDRTIAANRTAVRDVAGQAVAQLFSVSRSSWQADRARARGVVGGEFAESYSTVLAGPPADGIDAIVWRPDAVGLVDVGTATADVVISATIETVRSGGARTSARRSVQARLDQANGRWLVTRIDVLT